MSDIAEASAAAETVEAVPGFPSTVLALVERDVPDDGVAYVGALLERALAELAPRTRTFTVFPNDRGADPTFLQRGVFAARLIAAGRRADCVVYNHVGLAEAQAGLPASMRRPYAVFVHGVEAWDVTMVPARRRALVEATVRIASSEHTARRLLEVHPEAAPAAVCVLGLLPAADSGAVDGALMSSVTPRTIIIAGRMNADLRSKGHDELLEVWQTVLGRRPDARLVVVGRGDDVKRLETKATGLGLDGSVRFTGMVTEATLDTMLARAGAFALPSTVEGSGLSYLRAMRAAIPCIGSTEGAASEIIEDGRTGTLVPPLDRDALAQAVIDVLGDTARRRDMGEAGRARFEANYRFDHFRTRLDSIMRNAFRPAD